jgi:hypothetical protein
MKTSAALATALFALASFPIVAQQPRSTGPPDSPTSQQNPPATETSPAASPQASAVPQTPTAPMSPVNGEFVSKLDSKTAKTGDSVVIQTKTSVKTADGTEIPKGSKLVGHVTGVQPSGAGQNAQMALQFDRIELKGGQSVVIRSEIQSLAPPAGEASTSGAAAMTTPPAGGSSTPSAASGRMSSDPSAAPGPTSSAAAGTPDVAAGTVVAKNGNIAIRTTSIPGVLLANNAPGQQDPRMAQVSCILLGAKKDIQLDGGTQVVLGVSPAAGRTQ